MIQAAPKAEIDEILTQLIEIATTLRFTEFSLKQQEARVRRLLSTSPVNPMVCHMCLGLVGMIRGDHDLALAGMKNALLLGKRNAMVARNAITALSSLGSLRDSYDVVCHAAKSFPDDMDMLYCATVQAMHALQFGHATQLLDQFDKLALNDTQDSLKILRTSLARINLAAAKYAVSEEVLLQLVEAAVAVIRDEGFIVRSTSILALHDGTFAYQLYINADRDQCANVNFSIADALVERFENTDSELMSVCCRPYDDAVKGRALESVA